MTTQHTTAPAGTQEAVAASADAAGHFAAAPALLLELSEALGRLAADANRLTERGRRPFRPDDAWTRSLGELGYRAYLLADQSGVALDSAVREAADEMVRSSHANGVDPDAWPLQD